MMKETEARFLTAIAILAGFVIASGAVAGTFALLLGDARLYPLSLPVIFFYSVIFGLGLYVMIRSAGKDTWVVASLAGFTLGAAPMALFAESIGFIVFFGLFGAGAALLLWLIVPRSRPVGEPPSPLARRHTALLSIAAAGVIAAVFLIPEATEDRSCHNMSRDGRTSSLSPLGGFYLVVGTDQWRAVETEMLAFRAWAGWQYQGKVRTDDGFPWLQLSLCHEPGTNILVTGLHEQGEVAFFLYQPKERAGWESELRMLYERIRARWPESIEFRDSRGGETTAPPAWAHGE